MTTYLNSVANVRLSGVFIQRIDTIFLLCATVGLTLFFLRGLFFVFGGYFGDLHEGEHADYEHHDVEPAFKFLTIHTLTGFLMIFGLVGLGVRYQKGFSSVSALGFSFLAGLGMMLLVAAIFYGASLLTSSGATFSVDEAVGMRGVMYLSILPPAEGKVHVTVRGITRELSARSRSGQKIEAFTHVEIIKVIDSSTVEVDELVRDA